MTKILFTALAAFVALTNAGNIEKLWKSLDETRKADRPADELSILDRIKGEAARKLLTWDYYRAWDEYVSAKGRINWKDYATARKEMDEALRDYPQSVIQFYQCHSDEALFVRNHEQNLRKSCNREFWEHDWRISRYPYSEALTKAFENDLDYACYASGIKEAFDGRYPLDALMEYQNTKEKDLQAYCDKYAGKAVSLLSRGDLLIRRLQREGEDYLKLKADCEAFERDRKAFKGDEALIAASCNAAQTVLETLHSRAIYPGFSKDSITLGLRNIPRAAILLKDNSTGKTVWKGTATNDRNSFYSIDTVKVPMPALPDGEYAYVCARGTAYEASGIYGQYTLSIAIRTNAGGPGIFVTDFVSGEPLKECSLMLYDRDSLVHTSPAITLGEGFTPIPREFIARAAGIKSPRIRACCGSRLSKTTYAYLDPRTQSLEEKPLRHCTILTDRAAFNPDETVHFKCIVYDGTFSLKPAAQTGITVTLQDAEGKILESRSLRTDSLGSADGSFILRRTSRGGMYSITVKDEALEHIATRRIRVDDFVLPDFELVFDGGDEQLEGPLDTIRFSGRAAAYSGHSLSSAKASFVLERNWEKMAEGPLAIGGDGSFDLVFPLSGWNKDNYLDHFRLTVRISDGTGETLEFEKNVLVRLKPVEKSKGPREHSFEELEEEEGIALRVISCPRPTWAVAELYGSGNVLLSRQLLRFSGQTTLRYGYEDAFPDAVSLHVLYFQDRKCYHHTLNRRRQRHDMELPVGITRFLDTTAPAAHYEFALRTAPGAQCTATVFDKSTETVQSNRWDRISATPYPYPDISIFTECGADGAEPPMILYKSKGATVMNASVRLMADAGNSMAEEEAIPYAMDVESSLEGGYIRSNFANTIAWEPCLEADSEGNVRLTFDTSDKLSTYYVQFFAHDSSMRSATIRREMKVTLPVRIAVVEPRFLYTGDRVTIAATVSNATAREVKGSIIFNDGTPVEVTVPASGSAVASCSLDAEEVGEYPLKVVFKASDPRDGSDGVLVKIPVYRAAQTLTEAHSALLKAGMDPDSLVTSLRGRFVNIPGADAVLKERSIIEMIGEALPEEIEPRGDNSIALSSAILARKLIGEDYSELMDRLMSRRLPDGGFAWFDGMDSSPVITALVLEMLCGMVPQAEASVHYLDRAFAVGQPSHRWCQWISTAQYLYVRSLYSGIDLQQKLPRDRKKEVKDYLCPSGRRGLEGMVFPKARRAATLLALSGSDGGRKFALKAGIRLMAGSRLAKSAGKDLASLEQYAVEHPSGGICFPNAVMPWRGLLESELYAHVFMSRLFEGTPIPDGILLWFMVQKEIQQWGSDPAYIMALQSVLNGSEELKRTRVAALSGEYTKPFGEIVATGNGFDIRRTVPDGVKVGDKVTLECHVSSDENRSFVHLTLPFPAGLIPVDQKSGYCHWRCYRSVLKDRIEYWYDTFPEGDSVIREEFFVQREGGFQSPAAEVVCDYADHYRANTEAGSGTFAGN